MAKTALHQEINNDEINLKAADVLLKIPKQDRLNDIVPMATSVAAWILDQLFPCGEIPLREFNTLCCSMFVNPKSVLMRLKSHPHLRIDGPKAILPRIRIEGPTGLKPWKMTIPDTVIDAKLNYACRIAYIAAITRGNASVFPHATPNDGIASHYLLKITEESSPPVKICLFSNALYYATESYRAELKPFGEAFLNGLGNCTALKMRHGIHPCREDDRYCRMNKDNMIETGREEAQFDLLPQATAYAREILEKILTTGRYSCGEFSTGMLFLMDVRPESVLRRLPCIDKITDPNNESRDYFALRGDAEVQGDISHPERLVFIPKPNDDAIIEVSAAQHELFLIYSTNPPRHRKNPMVNPTYARFFEEKFKDTTLSEEIRVVAFRQFLHFIPQKELGRHRATAYSVLTLYHFVQYPANYERISGGTFSKSFIKYFPEVPK